MTPELQSCLTQELPQGFMEAFITNSEPVGPARTPSRKNLIFRSLICMDIFEVT